MPTLPGVARLATQLTLSGLRAAGIKPRALTLHDVLSVASALVDRQGFQATTLAQIADAAGLSRNALGQFVQSRAELLQALVARTTREFLAFARAPQFDQLGPGEALEKLVRDHCRAVLNYPSELQGLVRGRREVGRAMTRLIESRERAFVVAIRRVIERGIEHKVFRPMDAGIATQLTLDAANSLLRWYRAGGKLALSHVIDEAWAFIAHALGVAKTARSGKRLPRKAVKRRASRAKSARKR